MTDYEKWLYDEGCCNENHTPCGSKDCSCEGIYLEINNVKTDVRVVSGEVENKLDASAYTPVDLSDYYTKEEVDNLIPTVPTNVSEFNNDAGYINQLKTINGESLVGEGDIVISGGSGITSGEVQTLIDSNLTDYYTKEEVDNRIPSLSGYATEQWVLDKNYITGVDLSNYALLTDIPTSNSAFTNDEGYINQIKTINGESLIGTGDIVISGGSGTSITVDDALSTASTNPVQNKVITGALNGKLDASAYTPTDLSNYYNKQEVNALIPTVPTSNSAFTNDMHYVTSGNVETQITNHFYCCSENEWITISGNTQPDTLYLIY